MAPIFNSGNCATSECLRTNKDVSHNMAHVLTWGRGGELAFIFWLIMD